MSVGGDGPGWPGGCHGGARGETRLLAKIASLTCGRGLPYNRWPRKDVGTMYRALEKRPGMCIVPTDASGVICLVCFVEKFDCNNPVEGQCCDSGGTQAKSGRMETKYICYHCYSHGKLTAAAYINGKRNMGDKNYLPICEVCVDDGAQSVCSAGRKRTSVRMRRQKGSAREPRGQTWGIRGQRMQAELSHMTKKCYLHLRLFE